jgi:hypothetical protein
MGELVLMQLVVAALVIIIIVLTIWAIRERSLRNSLDRSLSERVKEHWDDRKKWDKQVLDLQRENQALQRQAMFWLAEAKNFGCQIPSGGEITL